MSDSLGPNGRLGTGDSLDAAGGKVHLAFQADGDLVLLCDRANGQETRWHSNTAGLGGSESALLDDGTLVIRDGQDQVIWRSGITAPVLLAGHLRDRPSPRDIIDRAAGRAKLVVEADENVVIYLGSRPVWSTGTSLAGEVVTAPDLKRLFVVEPDGTRTAISREAVVDRFGGLGYARILDAAQMRQ